LDRLNCDFALAIPVRLGLCLLKNPVVLRLLPILLDRKRLEECADFQFVERIVAIELYAVNGVAIPVGVTPFFRGIFSRCLRV
jgi:hypothetical protein